MELFWFFRFCALLYLEWRVIVSFSVLAGILAFSQSLVETIRGGL